MEGFLRKQGVTFEKVHHKEAFTAQRVAAAEHVTGKEVAKTVVVKGGDKFFLLVLPANLLVNMAKASQAVGAQVAMASEEEMAALFTECDVGAEPPFGSQFGLSTFVDRHLAEQPEMVFRAGTHTDTIVMAYADYAKAEKPTVADFSNA